MDHQFVSSLVRSLSPLIAAFLAVEIEIAVLAGFRIRPPPLPLGMPYDRDRGQAVLPDRIGALNSWAR